jgi:hypothetical protein
MSINVLWILTLLFGTNAQFSGDELKCREFRTGRFMLNDKKIDRKYVIERNDTLQIETELNTGDTSKYKVTWVSDCEYQLNILEGREELMNFYRGRTLTIRILETYKNGYKFEGQLEGFDYRPTQVVERIK